MDKQTSVRGEQKTSPGGRIGGTTGRCLPLLLLLLNWGSPWEMPPSAPSWVDTGAPTCPQDGFSASPLQSPTISAAPKSPPKKGLVLPMRQKHELVFMQLYLGDVGRHGLGIQSEFLVREAKDFVGF